MDLMSGYVSERIQIVIPIVSIPSNQMTQGCSHTHTQGSERKAYHLQTQSQNPKLLGLQDPQRLFADNQAQVSVVHA